jgi:hypothetical protein
VAAGQWPGLIAEGRKQLHGVGEGRRPVIAERARDHLFPPCVLWRQLGLVRIPIAKPVASFAEYARAARTFNVTLSSRVFPRNRRGTR